MYCVSGSALVVCKTTDSSYKIRMQSRCRGTGLMCVKPWFLDRDENQYLVGYRSRSAKHPRSGRRRWHSWLQSRHTCEDTLEEAQELPVSYATLVYTAPWPRTRLHACDSIRRKAESMRTANSVMILWRSLGIPQPKSGSGLALDHRLEAVLQANSSLPTHTSTR